jgi:hypothetical protein
MPNGPISIKEVRDAKERMRRGKAGGIDGILVEIFLGSGDIDGPRPQDENGRRLGDRL